MRSFTDKREGTNDYKIFKLINDYKIFNKCSMWLPFITHQIFILVNKFFPFVFEHGHVYQTKYCADS